VQVQRSGYRDDARIELTVPGFRELRDALAAMPHVNAVSGRAEAFALASAHDRSFGAMVMGVVPEAEPALSNLADYLVSGRYLAMPDEVVAGALLAHNLDLAIGDELVVLGNAVGGGVAPLAVRLVGIVETGQTELDRTLLQIHLDAFSDAFALNDEVHAVVLRLDDLSYSRAVAEQIQRILPDSLVALPWNDLMPELEQTVSIKRIGADFLFVLLLVLVVFSVVNTFMMTVYERTRELGMLAAIGMRRGKIVAMLHVEALLLAALGIAIGDAIASGIVTIVAQVGITLGDLGETLRRYHMPDRLRPALDPVALGVASFVMVVAVQVAASVATSKIRGLSPVEALRGNE
jgi:ABC-type lipoprotein release transport system permease subunit